MAKISLANDKTNAAITIFIAQKIGSADYSLRFLTPLGVLLPGGITFRLGQETFGKLGFIRCRSDGCIAETKLEGNLLAKMKSNTTAQVAIQETPTIDHILDFRIDGLAKHLDRPLVGN